MQPIKLENLREMVQAGAVQSAEIVGQKGGFAVVAKIGMQQRALGTKLGEVRVFSVAGTAIKTLLDMGLKKFSVDVTHYEAGTLRAPRTDIAKRHSRAREALAHDEWFRKKVKESLDEIKNGTAVFVDHDDMWDRLEAHTQKRVAERGAEYGNPIAGKHKRKSR